MGQSKAPAPQRTRPNRIRIIDPATNQEVKLTDESKESPGSGSSSNRETPRLEGHGPVALSVKSDSGDEVKGGVNGPAHMAPSPSQIHLEEPPSLEAWNNGKRASDMEQEEVAHQQVMMYHQSAMVPPMTLQPMAFQSAVTPVVSARSDGPERTVDVFKGPRAGAQQFSPQRKKNEISNRYATPRHPLCLTDRSTGRRFFA